MRILKWKRSFFQVVQTILNRNHEIDRVLVESSENLIMLIDDKQSSEHDTLIHVYQCHHSAETDDDQSFETKRIQIIPSQYDLSTGNIFLYHSYVDHQLYMSFCDGNLLEALPLHRCEQYIWRIDGVDNVALFQRIERWQTLEKVSSVDLDPKSIEMSHNRIITENELLAMQFGVSS